MIFSRKDRKVRLSLSAKIAVCLSAALVIGAAGYVTYNALGTEVTIKNGGSTEKEIFTFKNTVGEALKEQGITLGKHDKTNHDLDKALSDDMTIEVYRAMAVEVTADGKTQTVHTTKRVIEDILADADIKCTEEDEVIPSRKKIAKADTEIVIVKRTSETITLTEEIPFAVTEKANASLESGVKKVVQKGSNGQKEKIYKVSYADGVEVGREMVEEKVVTASVNEVVEIGTKKVEVKAAAAKSTGNKTVAHSGGITTARDGSELSYSKVLTCTATAYDAVSCGKQPGQAKTATGAIAARGVIAVDPSVIPLGTRVYVEGYGYATAADTGSAIKGNIIDVCMDTTADSMNWGRRSVKVYILN